jgi:hypothetical protein
MFNDNPKQTGATPFLSVSLNYAELEPELNAFIHATLMRSPELLEAALTDLIETVSTKGALFLAVEKAMKADPDYKVEYIN